MTAQGSMLLTRKEVAALLSLDECIAAVERAFLRHARGETLLPGVLGVHAHDGGFHIKAAGLHGDRAYFAAKINANFPLNRQRHGLPTIQGAIVLCDGKNGSLLAIMDSIEITTLRTGAASAVAAKHLARADAAVATICGCGTQGRIQLCALVRVRPIQSVFAWDADATQVRRFVEELSGELGIEISAAPSLLQAIRQSDVCVTCTPSRQAFLKREYVAPGTFIAAVGADNPEKQELDPDLFAGNKIVVDSLEQCTAIGDLHHALAAGRVAREDVHAELHEIVAGSKPGRVSADEIILFDSTGTALQDVAAAAVVYERALNTRKGVIMDLSG